MKKNNFNILISIIMLCCGGNVWGEEVAIVAGYNGNYYAMNKTVSSGKLGSTAVAVVNNKVYCTEGGREGITWIQTVNGSNCTFAANDEKYLEYTSKTSISLSNSSYNWYKATDGKYLIENGSSRYLGFFHSTKCFGAYTKANDNDAAIALPLATSSDNTYTRSVTKGQIGTLCLPFAVSKANISGAEFYRIVKKNVDGSGNPTSIVLEEVDDLVAGVAYIFQATSSSINITFDPATVVNEPIIAVANGLVGVFAPKELKEGEENYIVSSNKIVKCGTGCSVGANRAYISMSAVEDLSSSAKNTITLEFADNSTGIEEIYSAGNTQASYGISGHRMGTNSRGIVIRDGKKYIQK